jgi:hypothetical protein
MNLVSGIYWWYPFRKYVKCSFFTTFQIFKATPKCSIFKCILWSNGSFLGGEHRGFWKRESRPIEWHQCCSLTRQLFFRLHIYSLRVMSRHYGHAFSVILNIFSVNSEIELSLASRDWHDHIGLRQIRTIKKRVRVWHVFEPPGTCIEETVSLFNKMDSATREIAGDGCERCDPGCT